MKSIKAICIIAIFSLFAPFASAATIDTWQTTLDQYEVEVMRPIEIVAEKDDEITKDHGIKLMLTNRKEVLWDKQETITVSGTAVDNSRVETEVTPRYEDDYKTLVIPIDNNFHEGEVLSLDSVRIRAYDQEIKTYNAIDMDIDGDGESDAFVLNAFEITASEPDDREDPMSVDDLAYEMDAVNMKIKLSWEGPADYDLASIKILKEATSTEDVVTEEWIELYDVSEYSDSYTALVKSINYKVYAEDIAKNRSDFVQVEVVIEEPAPVVEPVESIIEEPVVEPTEPNDVGDADLQPQEEGEITYLSRFYNYYKIRHAIKCRDENYACTWAKIDLVYAQEKTDKNDVNVSLTDREIELMGKRVKYSEMRYNDNCVNASEDAKYCPALGKALDRVNYFLGE